MNNFDIWYLQPIFYGLSTSQIWFVVSPFLAALVAAVITYFATRRRDFNSHKLSLAYEEEVAARQVRRAKLLDAYLLLDKCTPERLTFLELDPEERFRKTALWSEAISAVKLFGTEEHCKQIDAFVEELRGGTQRFNPDQFLNTLRDDLRISYGLKLTESRYAWVDFKKVTTQENVEN